MDPRGPKLDDEGPGPAVSEGPARQWAPLAQGPAPARRGAHKLYEGPNRPCPQVGVGGELLLVPMGLMGYRQVGFNFTNTTAAVPCSFAVFGSIGTIEVQVVGSPVVVAGGATGHLDVAELHAVLRVVGNGTTADSAGRASAQGVAG